MNVIQIGGAVAFQDALALKANHIDAGIGLAVPTQGPGDPPCHVSSVPGLEPGADFVLQIGNDTVYIGLSPSFAIAGCCNRTRPAPMSGRNAVKVEIKGLGAARSAARTQPLISRESARP